MSRDLGPILESWAYDPASVTARKIVGEDGSEKIQLRLDMGVLQMETEGRPDGSRPRGFDTLLDYFKFMRNTSKRLALSDEDFSALQQESVQFYYRYQACYALLDYEAVIRDTRHNLGILEFITANADEDTSWEFLQFKPYVLMMESRALAEKEAQAEDYRLAIEQVQRGLRTIREFWEDQGEMELKESSYEIEVLNELLQSLKERKPAGEITRLRDALHHAIETEDFERAAELRDRLARIDPPRAEAPAASAKP